MSRHNPHLVLAVLFLVPVVGCLVGIGALVHLSLSPSQTQAAAAKQDDSALWEKRDWLDQQVWRLTEQLRKEQASLAQQRCRAHQEAHQAAEQARQAHQLRREIQAVEAEVSRLEGQLARRRQQIAEAAIAPLPPQTDSGTPSAEFRRYVGEGLGPLPAGLTPREPFQVHPMLIQRLKEHRDKLAEAYGRLKDREGRAQAEQKQAQQERDRLRQKRESQRRQYSVLALSGGSVEPARRPVFVECARDAVILAPAGIRLSGQLTPQDQARFLAAVRRQGYVAFLIRPDGFETFRKYRNLVISENRIRRDPIPIGFEPVDADWSLVYPQQEGGSHVGNAAAEPGVPDYAGS